MFLHYVIFLLLLDQNTAGVHNDSIYDDAGSYDSEIYDDVSFNIDQAFDQDESADEDYRLNEEFLHDYVTMSKCNMASHITQRNITNHISKFIPIKMQIINI